MTEDLNAYLVRHVVPRPGDNVERAVALPALEELPSQFIGDFPGVVLSDLISSNGVKEVPSISKPIRTERAQLRQFKVGAPNLEDIASGWAFDLDLEPLTSLDNADLTGLDVQEPKLGLDI